MARCHEDIFRTYRTTIDSSLYLSLVYSSPERILIPGLLSVLSQVSKGFLMRCKRDLKIGLWYFYTEIWLFGISCVLNKRTLLILSGFHHMTGLCSSLCILGEMFGHLWVSLNTFIIGSCMSSFPATSRVPIGSGTLLCKRLLVLIWFEVLQHRMCTRLRG